MAKTNVDQNMIHFIKGKAQILFSAPHSFPHLRPSLTGTLKQEERLTDQIVIELAKRNDGFGLIAKDTRGYDPNYITLAKNPFKRKLKSVVEEYGIKYLLDIHGLHEQKNYDVAIYYEKWFRNSRELAYSLAEKLDRSEMKGTTVQIFYIPEGRQETISTFASKELRIPAVQVEVAQYIRKDNILRELFIERVSDLIPQLKGI